MILRKDWVYLDWRKYLYIDISNPKRTMNKLKGIFKPLKCYFRFSKKNWNPILWCSTPAWIHIMLQDVGWKDKYETPRYEYPPYIWIHIFNLNFIWYWNLPDNIGYTKNDVIDDYWEQALWYLYYHNTYSQGLLNIPNIKTAIKGWPWQDYSTKLSSWNNKFLVK